MSITTFDPNRNLLPIWRFSDKIYRSAEFTSHSDRVRLSSTDNQFLEKKIIEWEISPSIGKAIELVSCGISGNWINEVLPAAEYLLQNENILSPQVNNLISHVFNSSDIGISLKYKTNVIDWLVDIEDNDQEIQPITFGLASNAVSMSKKKLRNEPRNTLAWLDMALGYTILGQNDKALSSIQKALILAPNHRYITRAAVRLYIHFNRPDVAYSLLLGNPRTAHDPWLMASELSVAKVANKKPKFIRRAREIFQSRKFSPQHLTELYSAVGTIEFESGEIRKARKSIRASLERPIENTIAQAQWLADKLSDDNIFETINDNFIANLPYGSEAKTSRALVKNEWQNAFHECLNWLSDEPFSSRAAEYCTFISSTLYVDYNAALKCAHVGLKATPTDNLLLNNITVLYAYLNNLDKARNYFTKIYHLDKKEQNYYVYSATEGLLRFRNGDIVGGRQKYNEAEDHAPDVYKHQVRLYRAREELNAIQNSLNKDSEEVVNYIEKVLNTSCHRDDKFSPRIKELISEDFNTWANADSIQERTNAVEIGASWLSIALDQLEHINEEAAEENYPEVDNKSISIARGLLQKLCDNPIEPIVYPSMDGDVSIFFKSQTKSAAVLIRIDNNQQIVCHSSINKYSKRKHYSTTTNLPDDFMKNQLLALN